MLSDDDIMAQVLAIFQEEQAEHRQAIGDLLIDLEINPDHPQRKQLLDQLFREAHSLKGGAQAAGIAPVEALAHRIEDMFGAARDQRLALSPDVCDPIYAALDAIGALMGQVARQEPVSLDPHQPLLGRLAAALGEPSPASGSPASGSPASGSPAAGPPDQPAPQQPAPPGDPHVGAAPRPAEPEEAVWRGDVSTIRLSTAALDNLLYEAGELMAYTVRARQRAQELRRMSQGTARWRRIWRQSRAGHKRLQSYGPELAPTVHYLEDRYHPGHYTALPAAVEGGIELADLKQVLEALNQANAIISDLEERLSDYTRQAVQDHSRLYRVTTRLQEQISRTRMLPVATLFSPLRVQVREMARSAGKQAVLHLDDAGAEADRQVLEQLREVLIHLLRNAVDHGIEPAATRQEQGKEPEGTLQLSAHVGGDYLTLTLTDDGAGLDLGQITRRALAGGLLSEADTARMAEADLIDLIFMPGFSTRQTVSALSGRGVGLDIARAQVERMHGFIMADNAPGGGARFTVRVPLSLTSTRGLIIQAGGQRYVLAIDAIHRIIAVKPNQVAVVEGRPALLIEGRPVALVPLGDLLSGRKHSELASNLLSGQALLLGSGERQILCLIEAVLGEQELVQQRLPPPLQRVRGLAGATIMADGSVVPVLDAVDLLQAALGARQTIQAGPAAPARRRQTILVVDDSITTRTLEKNILESAGYTVLLATDGVEALELLQRQQDGPVCDLLLSDVDMPRLNGFELTARLRADQRFRHLPIILVTSLDTPADRQRGITAGADSYIVKRAFDQHHLLDTIAQLI